MLGCKNGNLMWKLDTFLARRNSFDGPVQGMETCIGTCLLAVLKHRACHRVNRRLASLTSKNTYRAQNDKERCSRIFLFFKIHLRL